MKWFTITTEKGSKLEMAAGQQVVLELDGEPYRFTIEHGNKIYEHGN